MDKDSFSRHRPQDADERAVPLERELLAIADLADEARHALRRGESGFAAVATRQIGASARDALRLIGAGTGGGR